MLRMVKHLLAIKLMPDKSLIHMPPPPQSNACGQVTDRRDRRDRRVDKPFYHLPFSLLENPRPTPIKGGFCVLREHTRQAPPSAPSAPSESMRRALPAQPRAQEGTEGSRRGTAEYEQAKRREFLFLPQAQKPRETAKTQGTIGPLPLNKLGRR